MIFLVIFNDITVKNAGVNIGASSGTTAAVGITCLGMWNLDDYQREPTRRLP